MKKVIFLTMAFIALLFSSCGKEDSSSTPEGLVGIWQVESTTIEGQLDILDDCAKKTVLVLTQDKATLHHFVSEPVTGKCIYTKVEKNYKQEGNTIKNTDDTQESYTYTLSGDTLTLTSKKNGVSTIYKWKKIAQTQLDAILASVDNGRENNNSDNSGNNNNNGGNNNSSGDDSVATAMQGIWQIEEAHSTKEDSNFTDCEKKSVFIFTQSRFIKHSFGIEKRTDNCTYEYNATNYRMEGSTIRDLDNPNEVATIRVTGDRLYFIVTTHEAVVTLTLKKITQAQLDTILATAGVQGGNSGGGNQGGNIQQGTAADLQGIWRLEAIGNETGLDDCAKKTVFTFTQNKFIAHDFSGEEDFSCSYEKKEAFFTIEGYKIKFTGSDTNFVFVILGNKLSLVTKDEESQYLAVLRFKRITQAELNSILATR